MGHQREGKPALPGPAVSGVVRVGIRDDRLGSNAVQSLQVGNHLLEDPDAACAAHVPDVR